MRAIVKALLICAAFTLGPQSVTATRAETQTTPQENATQKTMGPEAPAAPKQVCPGNSDPLGVSRVVEIDTTGGPGFGFQHYKNYDFLQPKEVVLTFDDGPLPGRTTVVLLPGWEGRRRLP
jgi:peptidoglycan-N-acetylglucosamine deacetylase